MSHTCKNLVIHCMDFRLMEDIKNYLGKNGIMGDCDEVSVAGAAKDLAAPEWPSSREFILKQIRISHDLHNMRRVILMHHTDCGAYGGHKAFADELEEEQKHIRDMQEAAGIIKSQWQDVDIKLILIKIAAGGNEFREIG